MVTTQGPFGIATSDVAWDDAPMTAGGTRSIRKITWRSGTTLDSIQVHVVGCLCPARFLKCGAAAHNIHMYCLMNNLW